MLAALGVPAATEDERTAALVAHDRDYWSRALPPAIVARAGSDSSFWVHVTHGDPVGLWIRLEDGSVRAGMRQLENHTPPYDLGDRLVGEATFELPADLPLGYHRLYIQAGSTESSTPLIVVPAEARAAAAAGRQADMGAGHPALQRAVRKILGRRRFDRPDRPRGVVRRTLRRRVHPGQPDARRCSDRADGAVAVSAHIAALRQPAVSAARGDSRVRRGACAWPYPDGHGLRCRRMRGARI